VTQDLFRVKLAENAKPRIELFGLPPDLEATGSAMELE